VLFLRRITEQIIDIYRLFVLHIGMTFSPRFTITPRLSKLLADIEVSRHLMTHLPVTAHMLVSLRQTARIKATHHSTAIEGNRLTQEQVRDVIEGGGRFPNREKDESEVRHYYKALDFVEKLAIQPAKITEIFKTPSYRTSTCCLIFTLRSPSAAFVQQMGRQRIFNHGGCCCQNAVIPSCANLRSVGAKTNTEGG
jgi:hypothetical protein